MKSLDCDFQFSRFVPKCKYILIQARHELTPKLFLEPSKTFKPDQFHDPAVVDGITWHGTKQVNTNHNTLAITQLINISHA